MRPLKVCQENLCHSLSFNILHDVLLPLSTILERRSTWHFKSHLLSYFSEARPLFLSCKQWSVCSLSKIHALELNLRNLPAEQRWQWTVKAFIEQSCVYFLLQTSGTTFSHLYLQAYSSLVPSPWWLPLKCRSFIVEHSLAISIWNLSDNLWCLVNLFMYIMLWMPFKHLL